MKLNLKRGITDAQADQIAIWLGIGVAAVVAAGVIELAVWLLTRG
jgi:hypothetical protein